MPTAITRTVSRSIANCELTHVARRSIDLERARREHDLYCDLLSRLGSELVRLPEEPDLPDSVFVEDTALVLPERAIMTRPGATVRRGEIESVARALGRLRPLEFIEAPATLDGGDVVVIESDVFVGLSSRSSAEGIDALGRLIRGDGYRVHGIDLVDCLHLKSAACLVAPNTILVNPAWVDPRAFGDRRVIEIDPSEPFAANAFPLGNCVVHAEEFPLTGERMESAGLTIAPIRAGELAKAEGGVTCCSLIVG